MEFEGLRRIVHSLVEQEEEKKEGSKKAASVEEVGNGPVQQSGRDER